MRAKTVGRLFSQSAGQGASGIPVCGVPLCSPSREHGASRRTPTLRRNADTSAQQGGPIGPRLSWPAYEAEGEQYRHSNVSASPRLGGVRFTPLSGCCDAAARLPSSESQDHAYSSCDHQPNSGRTLSSDRGAPRTRCVVHKSRTTLGRLSMRTLRASESDPGNGCQCQDCDEARGPRGRRGR